MQTREQYHFSSSRYKIWHATREIIKSKNGTRLRNLFKGTVPTICRDVPGFAAYFVVFEGFRSFVVDGSEGNVEGVLTAGTVFDDGLFGLLFA